MRFKVSLSNVIKIDRLRHILKAISYRIYSTSITIGISYLVTGNLTAATTVGLFDFIVKLFTYYAHERIWYHIPFGIQRPRKTESRIDWKPNPESSMKQVSFIQHEDQYERKRVKILKDCDDNYCAILSSLNNKTNERYSDIILGNKEDIERKLNINLN
jgi:uncharacterized membrane protein